MPPLTTRMTPEDASFLYFENPTAPLHIGSVGIFEGTIDFERLYASLESRMHLIPRYRQRAVIPPFYAGHPTWEDDPEFSLSRHLRLVTLPAPGTLEQLRRFSGELFQPILARDRPLWDITVIHGLEGGRSALLSRVHHCLVDGVSGVELLIATMDLVPNPEPTPPPTEPWSPKPLPTPAQSWADAVAEEFQKGIRRITDFQQQLFDPREQFRAATRFARAMEVTVPTALQRATPLPWNKRVTSNRLPAWTAVNFQEVRGIRGKLGGTVNDVILTILAGGLGRYLRDRGVATAGQKLRLMTPVNVRSESEQGALGNRVSMMLPQLPLDIENPAERLVAVRAEMERLKATHQADAFWSLNRLAENIPAALYALAGMAGTPTGQVNAICTNVPGPLIPLYSVGHRMVDFYPMFPLSGDIGIGIAITSYDKALYIGIMSDPTIVDDVEAMRSAVDEDFRLLRTLAQVPESDLPDIGATRGNGHGNGHAAPPRPAATAPEGVPAPAAAAEAPGATPIETVAQSG